MKPCIINRKGSPQFRLLIQHWKKDYPHIEEDLEDAFKSIETDRAANQARQKPGYADLWKYRQKSSDVPKGASYGLRIYALYEKSSNTLHPIIVYPKPKMQEFDPKELKKAVQEMIKIIGQGELDLKE